jgi:hypothetical protein
VSRSDPPGLLKQQDGSTLELEQLRGVSLSQTSASATTLGIRSMAGRASMPAEESLKAIVLL